MAKDELVTVIYRGPSGAFIAAEPDGDVTFHQGQEIVAPRELVERLQAAHPSHVFDVTGAAGGVIDDPEVFAVGEQGPEQVEVAASDPAVESDTSATEGDPVSEE